MIYLTEIGLTPGGSSTVHINTQTIHKTIQSTQTIHRTTQSTQTIHRTTQFTNWEECGPYPVCAKYTLAFALQLRKRHGKPSVRVAGECQLAKNIQNRAYMSMKIHEFKNTNTYLETYRIKQKYTKHTTIYKTIKKNQNNVTILQYFATLHPTTLHSYGSVHKSGAPCSSDYKAFFGSSVWNLRCHFSGD
jgi:hypothetical protein